MASGQKSDPLIRVDSLNAIFETSSCASLEQISDEYAQVKRYLANGSKPILKVKSSQFCGFIKFCEGDLDSAIYFYTNAIKIGEQNNLRRDIIPYYSRVGFLFQSAGQLDSSSYYFKVGLDFSKELGDSLMMGSSYVGLGTNWQQQGKIDSALASYFKALKLAEKIDNKSLIITSKLNISTVYYDHQPENLRQKEFREMLKLARSIGDIRREVSILEWLGYLKTDSLEYDSALYYFQEGLHVNGKNKDINTEILLRQGITYLYDQSGQHQESIDNNNEIIELAIRSGFEFYLPNLYLNNVTNYIAQQKFKEAIESGKKAIEVGKKSDQLELYYRAYAHLATAYFELGDYQQAYQNQQMYTQLSQEILDDRKAQQMNELRTQYESEKKEAEILSLSQQASIQALEIQQKNQVIIIGIIAFLFVMVATYLVYKQREGKKRQQQTELEQRFLRSQLNPHFISNALVAVQSFMLKNDSESAALYLTKFSKLMREILENSRKEFILVEEEINMLKNYLDIHKLRLGSFDYTIDLDENIDPDSFTIPPMFVQPFVENAVEHGIGDLKEGGKIDLTFKKEGDYISIAVNDNGKGLSPNRNLNHTSLSTTIIQERMQLFNRSLKKKIQLVVDNMLNDKNEVSGTKVELKVPFSYI